MVPDRAHETCVRQGSGNGDHAPRDDRGRGRLIDRLALTRTATACQFTKREPTRRAVVLRRQKRIKGSDTAQIKLALAATISR